MTAGGEAFTLVGARVFDGRALRDGLSVSVADGVVRALSDGPPSGSRVIALAGGVLAPGFVDLQVNGGGGHMVGAGTDAAALARLCAVHRSLGTAGLLPTLISAPREVTTAVLDAGIAAAASGVPGFLGLHLEGPHLAPGRAGAHDAGLCRRMDEDNLQAYVAAAARLPALLMTVAPEAVTNDQIARLAAAGIRVSLGHSDAGLAEAEAAFAAGATMATHLFNAMRGLHHREPGLVGAVLAGDAAAGLIADGHHVHPAVLKLVTAVRHERMFLVSDAMATAGTDARALMLDGRRVLRRDGRLTLEDGTLAGADLTLAGAVRVMVHKAGLPLPRALAMATSIPAALIGAERHHGHIAPGRSADLIHLDDRLMPTQVWMAGITQAEA
jgi:N-acetylglucosamine-6-phosphate deacetylase